VGVEVAGPLARTVVARQPEMPPTLDVLETTRILRLARPGRLLPWLGPALRGLAVRRFKARVCRFPPEVQEGERRYCKACPYIASCAYGRTVEPDPHPGARVPLGQEDATRPLVIAAAFPAPVAGRAGLVLPLRVSFVGRTAAAHADEFWAAMAEAGRDPAVGLDPDRTTFEVGLPEPPAPTAAWRAVEVPTDPLTEPGEVAWVKVRLTAPLLLRAGAEDGRRLVAQPSFADLLRGCLRTIGILFRLYGEPLPDAAFRPLKDLAAEVPTLARQFTVYRQPKWSRRSRQHALIEGVIGEAVYGPVPRILLPWLAWGGRLHVGSHRVAGAGGWTVQSATE
jgi:CRISPR-associated endoribonuclease Cas6